MSQSEAHVAGLGHPGGMTRHGTSSADFALVRHEDFESLLGQHPAHPISEREIVDLALERGRVLVQGPAGAGKSLLASQMASDHERHILVIDASDFAETVSSAIGAAFWLIDAVVGTEPGFVAVLDGLEAVSDEQFEWLIGAVDDYARDEPRVGFIVLDRIQRRSVSLRRWALVSLSGVEGSRVADGSIDWRNFAIYQHLQRGRSGAASPVELFRASFEAALSGTGTELTDLADAVLASRLQAATRVRNSMAVPRVTGVVAESLAAAGLASRDGAHGGATWNHRLVSLFLEANALVRREDIWGPETFRQLTDDGTQFEVLAFALDLLPDDRIGRFTRSVDDWSYVASGRMLAYDSQTAQRVPSDLQLALLLLMGRRQFSEIPATKLLASDILREHQSDVAREILEARDSSQLVGLAKASPEAHSDWWLEWLDLFSPPKSLGQELRQVAAIESTDGVIGWTAANSLCLQPLRPQARDHLFQLALNSDSETTRWRAVHAISGTARPEVAALAMQIFDRDSSRWVRYGALRSAILVTARLRSATKRRDAVAQLVDRSLTILGTPRLLDITESALMVENPPKGWLNDTGPLIESLWANSTSVAEQDRWRDLSRTLRSRL